LVVNAVKSEHELDLIQAHGIVVHRLSTVLQDMSTGDASVIESAAGAAFFDLVQMGMVGR
jgi:hypothetical protein